MMKPTREPSRRVRRFYGLVSGYVCRRPLPGLMFDNRILIPDYRRGAQLEGKCVDFHVRGWGPPHAQSTTELFCPKLWSAFQAALSRLRRCPSQMGSFQWKFVEYKEQNGFVVAIFAPGPGPCTR